MTKSELERLKEIFTSQLDQVNYKYDNDEIIKRVSRNSGIKDCIYILQSVIDGNRALSEED